MKIDVCTNYFLLTLFLRFEIENPDLVKFAEVQIFDVVDRDAYLQRVTDPDPSFAYEILTLEECKNRVQKGQTTFINFEGIIKKKRFSDLTSEIVSKSPIYGFGTQGMSPFDNLNTFRYEN